MQAISHNDDFVAAATAIIEDSSRYIRIRSALLDKSLFSNPDFLLAISSFARHSRYSEVRILIDYPEKLIQSGHGLIELMQRLSQKMPVKVYYDEKDAYADSLLIGDQGGVIIKPVQQDKEGQYSLNDRIMQRRLQEEFDQDWLKSRPAHELRKLSI